MWAIYPTSTFRAHLFLFYKKKLRLRVSGASVQDDNFIVDEQLEDELVSHTRDSEDVLQPFTDNSFGDVFVPPSLT